MKDGELQLLCVLLVTQVYNDIRGIVREELARVALKGEEPDE